MFPLPPSEAAVIGELQRLLGAREIEPVPVVAAGPPAPRPPESRPVEGARLVLWDAA